MVQKMTDNQGKASFDVDYGDYDVTVSKEGYTSVTETVQYRSNHKNFNIQVIEIPLVTITVVNSNNIPLEGMKVTVYDMDSSDKYMYEVLTDSNGQAKGYVPFGEHDVNIYDPNDNVHYFDSKITVTTTDKEFDFTWEYNET